MINRTTNIKGQIRGKLKYQEKLSNYTTLNIGGIAPMWFEPIDKEDLIKMLNYAKNEKYKTFIIGEGSNIIVSDKKLDYIIAKLSQPYFRKIEIEGRIIKAGAGVKLKDLIEASVENSLAGLEYFTLVPSTVGGGIKSNLTTKKKSSIYKFSNLIKKIKVLDKQSLKIEEIEVKKEEKLSLTQKIILEAEFNLKKDKTKNIIYRKKDVSKYRKETQDYKYPSCGCIFKNPQEISAGELIDSVGLKGKRIGGAMISFKHANFIVNYERATSNDIMNLIKFVKEKVFQNTGIQLETEVEIIR